jgi:hypothetical protein
MEYYIYMIEKYLTQPLSGIIYRPTYTYYHSHYHYHCHDQYHMMLISLSLSVSLSIYQNHDISHHFTLCRIISHHTKILYYTFTHINVYIYTHVIMFFLAISPYLCTTCPTGLPQGWRLSMWSCFFWQFPPIYAQLVPPGCRRAGACPSRPWGRAMASLRCPKFRERWELVSANRRMFNGLVCAKMCRNLFMYNHTNIHIYIYVVARIMISCRISIKPIYWHVLIIFFAACDLLNTKTTQKSNP